ncbi:hypothetical protein RND81_12G153300 [Saponaria officinalis]|uniref:Coenzyme Q-binding protein COQ10 START domain-containing protein n=1 Tax=Saponaria officinalis TaxID=3572 RepID=A0AAW1HB03_SAPOF
MTSLIFNSTLSPLNNSQFPANFPVSARHHLINTNSRFAGIHLQKPILVVANAYAVDGGFESGGERDSRVREERESRERIVNCEVEVVSWRERRIKAEICVNSDVESVWNALTDYERLADFVPNLIYSGRIPCPYPGRIWLEQRGLQRALYWHIEARVVLDLQEFLNSPNERELHFSMVDGDFKKFEGKWSVKSKRRPLSTTLSYEVNVIPRFNFPAIFLERIIRSDLPVNLRALACRAERNFEGFQNRPIPNSSTTGTADPSSKRSFNSSIDNDPPIKQLDKCSSSSTQAPLHQAPSETNSNWGIFGNVCRVDRPCQVDEIHLRRFDGLLENGGVHRCVAASITVKAPVRDVWNVLTAYERLPEIVPNLAISKVLSRDNNKVRIVQEGCKGLLYMVLHARVIMDLCEQLEQEISFEQVEGDFDSFTGKWQLERLGNHHTLLKYCVESKMRTDTFLSEALMEEVIYEDLPSNLCAFRDYIEKRTASYSADEYDESHINQQSGETGEELPSTSSTCGSVTDRGAVGSVSNASVSNPIKQKRKVPGLQQDIEVLKSEILTFISEHGQEGFMPMRKQLRLHGRVDIEKAINKMGGFRRIASLMNLSLAYKHRKPKGYWDNLESLEDEITRFQKNWGMDLSYMPSRKAFERAGRYDIARALEKWGGLHEVSRLLSLKLRHPNRQASVSEKKNDFTSSVIVETDGKPTSKTYVPQTTQKWLTELQDLDIIDI